MTVTETDKTAAAVATGRVVRVIGPVVDIEFAADQMPNIYNAVLIEIEAGELSRTITAEIALHVGDNIVRAISLKPTDGMRRGAKVTDTGAPISVPVGDVTKGKVWNVTGECLNADPATLEITERWPIHRDAPAFDVRCDIQSFLLFEEVRCLGDLSGRKLRKQDRPLLADRFWFMGCRGRVFHAKRSDRLAACSA